jgi:hypothetical protein
MHCRWVPQTVSKNLEIIQSPILLSKLRCNKTGKYSWSPEFYITWVIYKLSDYKIDERNNLIQLANFRFLVTMPLLNSTSGLCTVTQALTQPHTKAYQAYTKCLYYIVLGKLSITFTLYAV